ncbi:MAG TPA: hypothetical protein VMY37_22990 [Thermoguttaceae bacterium]|nr:hypothetical protein [Thermoguttaceae bacterium]
MHEHNHRCCGCLSARVSRRGFLAAAGASAAALQMGLLESASTLVAAEPEPKSKPRVRLVFIRPKDQAEYWMSWPGNDYNADERQASFTEMLTKIALELGIQLEVDSAALEDADTVDAALARMKQSPPDGIMVIQMHLSYWRTATDRFLENRGDVPTIVFSRLGTSFTGHLQTARKLPKVCVAATDGLDWLRYGMRMFKTIDGMKRSRLCIITGDKAYDRKLDVIGTTLHYIPLDRWVDEFNKAETTDEVRALADYYTKQAKEIREPKPEDVLNAAKNYFVAKRIMAAEGCDGISLNCLDLVRHKRIPCAPCIAWSKLNDEGSVGACEADWNAAISMRLVSLLFERPGFMQDPAPNTVENTLMGAHCSSPTKLDGFNAEPEPFILRNHHESETGVAPQVLWRVGQEATVMEFDGPDKIIVGTGRVTRNFDTPSEGGCRTSVELAMDDVSDTMDTKGFHQLFIYGKLDHELRAYGKLAGIEVLPIT